MCNFSDAIQARGEAIGQKRGEEIGKARGIAIGEENTKRMVALHLSEMHTPVEKIAQVLEMTVEKVKAILKEEA